MPLCMSNGVHTLLMFLMSYQIYPWLGTYSGEQECRSYVLMSSMFLMSHQICPWLGTYFGSARICKESHTNWRILEVREFASGNL